MEDTITFSKNIKAIEILRWEDTRGHVAATKTLCGAHWGDMHKGRVALTHMKMLCVHVSRVCCSGMSPRVNWYFYNCARPVWGSPRCPKGKKKESKGRKKNWIAAINLNHSFSKPFQLGSDSLDFQGRGFQDPRNGRCSKCPIISIFLRPWSQKNENWHTFRDLTLFVLVSEIKFTFFGNQDYVS